MRSIAVNRGPLFYLRRWNCWRQTLLLTQHARSSAILCRLLLTTATKKCRTKSRTAIAECVNYYVNFALFIQSRISNYPFFSCCWLCWLAWLVILARFSPPSVAGLRQQRQQKQKILVHVLGVSLGFGDSIAASSCFFRQHREQQQLEIRLQHGLQHLKQFKRLQQLGFSSSPSIVDFMGIIFFYINILWINLRTFVTSRCLR